jgi:hypothetical protein
VSSPLRSSVPDPRRPAGPRPRWIAAPERPGPAGAPPRRPAARAWARAVRIAIVPLAALAAAGAGLVFLVLLPICGIATLAEGVARACWGAVRGAPPPPERGTMSQD